MKDGRGGRLDQDFLEREPALGQDPVCGTCGQFPESPTRPAYLHVPSAQCLLLTLEIVLQFNQNRAQVGTFFTPDFLKNYVNTLYKRGCPPPRSSILSSKSFVPIWIWFEHELWIITHYFSIISDKIFNENGSKRRRGMRMRRMRIVAVCSALSSAEQHLGPASCLVLPPLDAEAA